VAINSIYTTFQDEVTPSTRR